MMLTIAGGADWLFGLWWGAAVLANLATVVLGLWPRRPVAASDDFPPVSVIVPVKGADPAVPRNLEALLAQDYPQFEVVFAVADPDDPAIAVIERAMARFPDVPARLATEPLVPSANPKLDNLRRGWRWAGHELVLLCDVNARFRREELRRLIDQLGAGVGLLTAVPVATEPAGFWGELEAAFFNGGGARWLIAADRAGHGVGVGQTMLLRRRDLQRVGGIDAMAAGVCEDAALAAAVRGAGLTVRMGRDPGWHPIGRRRFLDLWRRHLRWMCCRKYHALPLFIFEPAASPLGMAVAGGVWWGGFVPWPIPSLIAVHLALWFAIEAIYVRCQGWHLSWLSPLAWLAREAMIPALWLRASVARSLVWRGQRIGLPPVLAPRRQNDRRAVGMEAPADTHNRPSRHR
jgi:ceramide glucosyltransferase